MDRIISYIMFVYDFGNTLITKEEAATIKRLAMEEGFTKIEYCDLNDIKNQVNYNICVANDMVRRPGEDVDVPRSAVMTEKEIADTIRQALTWEEIEDLMSYLSYRYDIEDEDDILDWCDEQLHS